MIDLEAVVFLGLVAIFAVLFIGQWVRADRSERDERESMRRWMDRKGGRDA